jgi:hypothetical protein
MREEWETGAGGRRRKSSLESRQALSAPAKREGKRVKTSLRTGNGAEKTVRSSSECIIPVLV